MAPATSTKPDLTEPTLPRLRECLESLKALSESPLDIRRFYAEWLVRVGKAIGSDAVRVWSRSEAQPWEPAVTAGPWETNDSEAMRLRRETLLNQLAVSGRSTATLTPSEASGSLPVSSSVWTPISAAGLLRGIVEVRVPVVSEAAQAGVIKFLMQAAVMAERYHLLTDRRELYEHAAGIENERRLFFGAHQQLELGATARVLADDGRILIGCDRLTVLVGRGRSLRVAAVSAVDDVNDRSRAMQALREFANRSISADSVLTFPESTVEYDEATTARFEAYVDEHDVKRLVIVPLHSPTTKDRRGRETHDVIGALVVEYFRQAEPPPTERRTLEIVARCAATALTNAVAHESIFLHSLWKTLGVWRRTLLEPGTRRRTSLIAAAVVAAAAAAMLVPIDDSVYCRGTLQPVARRNVFAPSDGTVARVLVAHGERVAAGRPLLELRNTDLEIAIADLAGRRTSLREQLIAVERALLDEARQLAAHERARLAGEQSQIREQLASLERQADLYDEKRRLLTIVSPIDAVVTTWNAEMLLENRPVRQGQMLLTLADVGDVWELELGVPDDRSGRVVSASSAAAEPLRISFSPATAPGASFEARLAEIQSSAEVRGDGGNTVLVRAAVAPHAEAAWRPGAEVAAHIHCGRSAAAVVWTRDLTDFIRTKILFRWF